MVVEVRGDRAPLGLLGERQLCRQRAQAFAVEVDAFLFALPLGDLILQLPVHRDQLCSAFLDAPLEPGVGVAQRTLGFPALHEGPQHLGKRSDQVPLFGEERTAELVSVNRELQDEVAERKRKQERIDFYRERLRSLAAELSLAEEAERRAIASDLHDHIGQALTTLKMKVVQITVFKALREFLVNTIKHSGARRVTMAIGSNDGRLLVRYRDDGVGFY